MTWLVCPVMATHTYYKHEKLEVKGYSDNNATCNVND